MKDRKNRPTISRLFTDDTQAEAWLVGRRWPNGISCPICASADVVRAARRRPLPFRCRNCRRQFSVRSRSAMQWSQTPYSVWAWAFHLCSAISNPEHEDILTALPLARRTAWTLAWRIRESFDVVIGGSAAKDSERNVQGEHPSNLESGRLGRPARQMPALPDVPPECLATIFFQLPEDHVWGFLKGKPL